jgi:hypothetical protein
MKRLMSFQGAAAGAVRRFCEEVTAEKKGSSPDKKQNARGEHVASVL